RPVSRRSYAARLLSQQPVVRIAHRERQVLANTVEKLRFHRGAKFCLPTEPHCASSTRRDRGRGRKSGPGAPQNLADTGTLQVDVPGSEDPRDASHEAISQV